MHLHVIDYSILLLYVAFVLGIGFALNRFMKTSSDFFMSGRSISAWVAGIAFVSANIGALELVGMCASGAQYGIAMVHFYWLGAIPAMVFLAVFMMPFYYGSKARSVPEYLKMRFDERTHALNSFSFAIMTVFASGISMDALAKLLNILLGWNYFFALVVCSLVVLLYVLKGGLTSAIYTEVLQFFMIVLGFAPIVYLGYRDVGGWSALRHSLALAAQDPSHLGLAGPASSFAPGAWTRAWQPILDGPASNPMGVDWFSMFFGLSFVLSFGYWCTNFLVVQRAMAARDMSAARQVPLIGAVPKMLLPFLVILPGMIAVGLAQDGTKGYHLPQQQISSGARGPAVAAFHDAAATHADPAATTARLEHATGLNLDSKKIAGLLQTNASRPLDDRAIAAGLQDSVRENYYNGVILSLMQRYCPPGLLGLALTALLASFMSGMAGNVTAFNTVVIYDIYQAYLAPDRSDGHYMWMGRLMTAVGIGLSLVCALVATRYTNAMNIVQLVFGFVNAPLFATFVLGMFWARTTSHGAFFGLLGGTLTSVLFHGLTLASGDLPGIKGGWITVVRVLPSEMAQNFWLAAFAFGSCLLLTFFISLATRRTKSDDELTGLVYSLTPRQIVRHQPWYQRPGVIGAFLLFACLVLNLIFW